MPAAPEQQRRLMIECVTPYSWNYNTCLDEALRDQRANARPALKTHVNNMAQYDIILLGYPNWWASIPAPIASFLEEYDLSGKTIVMRLRLPHNRGYRP
jgi:putative NADPH-quinone reductase